MPLEGKIGWVVACVNEFARHNALSVKAAFLFLFNHGGIAFLEEHYEAEHLLSLDDTVEDLLRVCEATGGAL
jgi:hypothetical protein